VAVAVVAVLLPYLWDLVRVLADAGGRVVYYGDEALEALATRDVWTGHQLLGPYSRFGWHHPGPALFYWLSIPNRLFGTGGVGMVVGTLLLNAVGVTAIVLLVGKRAGPWAALWAAGCLALLHLSLGGSVWRDFWNPYTVIMPMLLFVVLAADAAGGTVASFCWALVAGSFAVQTHISTGPAVAVVLVVSLVAMVVARRSRTRARRRRLRYGAHRDEGDRVGRLTALAGLIVALAMWVPPLIDAVRHHPSNLTLLYRFFTARHPTHTLGEAIRTSLTSAVIVPFGRRGALDAAVTRSTATLTLAGLLLLAVAAIAIVEGIRRGRRFGPWLATISLVAFGAAVLGGTRVVGPIAQYLTLWEVFLPITLLLALGASILRGAPAAEPGTWEAITRPSFLLPVATAVAVCAAVTGTVVGLTQSAALAGPSQYTGEPARQEVMEATQLVRSALAPSDRVVRLTMATDPAWPIAAGVSLNLERAGYKTTAAGITRDWGTLFGASRRATGWEDIDVEFYQPAPPADQGLPPRGRLLGAAGPIDVYLNGH
jgi:hypothetical protein